MSLLYLQTDRLSDSQIQAWLGFLSIFSGLHDGSIRLVLQGDRLSDALISAYQTYFYSIRFDRETVIDWSQSQAFVFASETLTPRLADQVSAIRLLPSGPPSRINHTIVDKWRWALAADDRLAALAPPMEVWRPACSVLTSLFDGAEYLEGFLTNSAAWVGYGNLEHFIVRPASPGEEHDRLIEHGRDHPTAMYLWLPADPGLYEIWNLCARLSTAKYLSNANVDDRRAPDHVARLTACLESSSDCDVASSSLRNTDVRNLDWTDSADLSAWPPDAQDRDYRLDGLFMRRGKGLGSFNLPHCMPVWRTALHVTNGYFDEATYGPSADWEFWLRCGQQGTGFHLVGEPLGLHLKVPDSYWRRHEDANDADARVLARYTRAATEVVVDPSPRPLADAVSGLAYALSKRSSARLFWAFRELLLLRERQTAGDSTKAMLTHVASVRLKINDLGGFDTYQDACSSNRLDDKLTTLFDFVCHCLALAAIDESADAEVFIAFAREYDVVAGHQIGRLIKARVCGCLHDDDRERFYLQAMYDADAGAFWNSVQRVYRFAKPLGWFLRNLESCPSLVDFDAVSKSNRVFYYPATRLNPYQNLLYRSLGQRGVEIIGVEQLSTLDCNTLRAGDVIHIHWLRRLFDGNPPCEHEATFNAFVELISAVQAQGVRVYWTVHNRLMHDYPDVSRDKRFRQRLSALVDRVILHHPMQLDMISDWVSEDASVEITEHGNYLGCYPNAIDQQAARRSLGFSPDDTVLLVAGLIRPYKDVAGKAELLDAWLSFSPRRKLLVAGAVSCNKTKEALGRLPAEQVHVVNQFIEDNELQVFFNAASIVLLSYRDVLTSGSLMEALSFGRPVLAPATGSIPYYVADGFNGWLYRDDRGLSGLLNMIGDGNETLRGLQGNCRRAAESAQWP